MTQPPFHFRYDLTRRQRLVPHLRIWALHGPVGFAALILFSIGAMASALELPAHPGRLAFFAIAAMALAWLYRRFYIGLLDVLLRPIRHMDVMLEEKGLGFLANGERWWIFLDGIRHVDQLTRGIWTIQHCNGMVIHIPADLIAPGEIERIRAAGRQGLTPEGVRAVIERGRMIEQIERREKEEQRGNRQ